MGNIIELINSDDFKGVTAAVFENTLNEGRSFYTIPLSAEEEKALLAKVITCRKDNSWSDVLNRYLSRYILTNEGVNFLLDNAENAMAVKLAISQFKRYGCSPEQGEKACQVIEKDPTNKSLRNLLNSVCEDSRSFSPVIYQKLISVDAKLREKNPQENTDYAEAYRHKVAEYCKKNGLLDFYS